MNSGSWSAVMPWPIIGIHAALLPDGRVLTFGSDELGEQGGHKIYDIWDPKTGLHITTTDAIQTDEFCSAEILDPITGNMMITGGDGRPLGQINFGVPDVNTYDYQTGSLTTSATGHLNFPRWYGSLISLGGGRFLEIGGNGSAGENGQAGGGSGTPEIFTPGTGWKALPGAFSADIANFWWYPRVWMSSNGTIFGYSAMGEGDNAGTLFKIDPTGQGSVTNLGHTPFESEDYNPAAMFAADKILTIDKNGNGWIIDISGPTPTFTQTGGVGENRAWSNLTDLADGTVLLTGGSVGANNLATETNNAEIWNPATGQWTEDASAAIGRFYHSNTLLLPDGTVLSLGGGAPGPLTNLNAEIYTPGYLLNSDGTLRTDRPVITSAPKMLQQGQTFTITLDNADVIQKLELIKYGNGTHSFDGEQRAFSLDFTHVDAHTLQVTLPASANMITDGYWLLFADNNNGTPSVAATVKIGQVGVDILVPNFNTTLMLNGTASHVYGSNAITLTTDNAHQSGSVMSDKRIDLTQNFDLSFSLSMGDKASPADGMAFVLQNDPFGNAALGQGGSGLGASGLLNGLAIQFDTWQNVDQGDIAAEHTDIVTTDPRQATYRLTGQVALTNLTDGQSHQVHVSWNAATLSLTYTFDGVQVGQLQLTPQQFASYFGGSNYAYFGFTGSTGGASDLHQISLDNLNATFESGSPPGAPHGNDGSIFDVTTINQHTTVNGSASYQDANHIFTLTPDAAKQAGSVAFNDKVDLTHDFNMVFDLYFGPNHKADGMTFVLHNDPRGVQAIGSVGGNLGAIGLQNGLAIEFDTWQNAYLNDPAYNHTNIINTADGTDLTAATDVGNIVDGGWHQVGVTWDSQAHTLQYWVDGKLGGTLTGDIATQYLGGQTTAYFGFTGATGGATDVQQVRVEAVDAYFANISSNYANVQDPIGLSASAIVNGSASYDGLTHTFVLTPDAGGQAGSAMLNHRIDLSYDFQASFDVYLGDNSNGADGLAFVLQNDLRGANAIGAAGGNYGAIGINSGLGIALDTFQNANFGDMVGDHTDFFNSGASLETSRISDQLPIGGGNAKDGHWHNVMVSWNASNHTLTYWVDGTQMNTLNENIVAKYLGGSQYAYLGFTGGTGGAHNLQEVHLDTLTAWFEGQSHSVSTPLQAHTVL
jgi:Bacterial lectin/Domain of unknown function (DUF1929)